MNRYNGDGLNIEQVIDLIGKSNWSNFIKSLKGEPTFRNSDGKIAYLLGDVDYFIKTWKLKFRQP